LISPRHFSISPERPCRKKIQGKSWKPLFDDPHTEIRSGFFYEYFFERKFSATPTLLAYRTKSAKFVTYPHHEDWVELFDLNADPYERENLADSTEHSALRSRMEDLYEKEKAAVGYVYPDYTDKLWPEGYIHTKERRPYPWQNKP
tara:strand:- start:15984 stop:16421 length:438 start_codon:yes stop_codon:yes gene_type:complete